MKIDGYGAGRVLLPDGVEASLWRVREDLGMFLVVDSPNENRLGVEAAELVASEVESVVEVSAAATSGDKPATRDDLRARAKGAMDAANRVLYDARLERDADGDVVTVSAMLLLLGGDFAVLCHVGNCRMYLYRRGELAQLSREHIRSRGARQSTQILQRGMGLQVAVELDELVLDLAVGDFLLLASYSVYTAFDEEHDVLGNRLAGAGPRETMHIANQLVQAKAAPTDTSSQGSVCASCVVLHGYPEPLRAHQDEARGRTGALFRCLACNSAISTLVR